MALEWRFEQDDQAQWQWKLIDAEGGIIESPISFASQTACMINAARFAVQRRKSQSDSIED